LIAVFAFGAGAAAAQELEPLPVRAFAGGGLMVAQPVGEFSDFIGAGFGAGGHFLVKLDRRGILGFRADGGFIVYGHERQRVCLSTTVGCRIEVDLTTTNNIVFASIGPQLSVPAGAVQPYVNASMGFSYFATSSSISDTGIGDDEDFSTTNFDDGTFAWQAGTGLRIPLRTRTPVLLDVGARYNTNGRVEYLRKGDIIDNPDGSITLTPQRSEANLVTWLIGVSVGIRW
jgi:hypothetical protein